MLVIFSALVEKSMTADSAYKNICALKSRVAEADDDADRARKLTMDITADTTRHYKGDEDGF
jgi:hypothetical protein